MLCTLAQCKARLGIGDAETVDDAQLTELIEFVSAAMAAEAGRLYNGRPCLEKITLDVYISPDSGLATLWLPAWPVVSITQIKEAIYGAFADADALTVNEDYQLDAQAGAIYRIGTWLAGVQTVRVQYTGGYTFAEAWASGTAYTTGDVVTYGEAVYTCTDSITGSTAPDADGDHWTVATGEAPLPDQVNHAAVQQVAYEHQRRSKLGVRSEGIQGGSYTSYAKDELLPMAQQACRQLRRLLA